MTRVLPDGGEPGHHRPVDRWGQAERGDGKCGEHPSPLLTKVSSHQVGYQGFAR
jgi:hypothetical protein